MFSIKENLLEYYPDTMKYFSLEYPRGPGAYLCLPLDYYPSSSTRIGNPILSRADTRSADIVLFRAALL